jgi:hypothetical protein
MSDVAAAMAAFRAEYERIDAAMTRYPAMPPTEQAAQLLDIFGAFKSIPMLLDEVERLRAAHADCTNLSHAEAARIFEEAREQREQRDALLVAGDALAEYMESRWRREHEERCYSAYDREWTCGDGLGCQYKRPTPLDAWRALAPTAGEV